MPRRPNQADQKTTNSASSSKSRDLAEMSGVPESHRETWIKLTNLTDYAAFQSVCDAVLSACYGYEIRPRGQSVRGTVNGQPDTWGYDRNHSLCAMCYGTGADWQRKLRQDLDDISKIVSDSFRPQVIVFCTNRHIDASAERTWKQRVAKTYNWDLQLYGPGELAIALDRNLPHIRAQYLGLPLRRHSWESLLEVCRKHLGDMQVRFGDAYDPSLYVARAVEQHFSGIYREIIDTLTDGKPRASLLPIVDQSGIGKTALALHLANTYATQAPVFIFPGSLPLHSAHALEQEIVSAAGYPIADGVFQANLAHICDLAEKNNQPLIVIIDGIDRGDVDNLCEALVQLLTAHRNRGILVVTTCRDVVWPLIASREPALQTFNALTQHSGDDKAVNELSSRAQYSSDFSSLVPTQMATLSIGSLNHDEFLELRDRYLERWHVIASITVEAEEPLRIPLLLRIFAEGAQNRTIGLVTHLGTSDLWGTYLRVKIKAVFERTARQYRPAAIEELLEDLALLMLRTGTTVLVRDALDSKWRALQDTLAPGSLYLELEAAGIIVEEPERCIRFTYDLLLDFVLGQALARRIEQTQTPPHREEALQLLEYAVELPRWRHVVHIAAQLTSDSMILINRLRAEHLWAAAYAMQVVASDKVQLDVRAAIVRDLIAQLESRFAFDRDRAATLLGALQASEGQHSLMQAWKVDHSPHMLCALALLDVQEIALPLIRFLGHPHFHHLPERQLFVDKLPSATRNTLHSTACNLLQDGSSEAESDDVNSAVQVLGYLRDNQIITPLMTYLSVVRWGDPAALLALWRLETSEGDTALERALDALGALLAEEHLTAQSAEISNDNTQTRLLMNAAASALDALRAYGFQHTSPTRAVPFLKRLLNKPYGSIRSMAARALGLLGAAEIAPLLVTSSQLRDPSWGIDFAIHDALRAFGARIPVEPFIQMIQDPSTPDEVFSLAVAALGESRNVKAFPVLRDLITSQRVPQWHAIYALGQLGRVEAVPVFAALFETLRNEADAELAHNLSYHILEALGHIQHPSAYPILERLVKETSLKMDVRVFEALIATGRDRALPYADNVWRHYQGHPLMQSELLSTLLWLGSSRAIKTIESLVTPLHEETVVALFRALDGSAIHSFVHDNQQSIRAREYCFQLISSWLDKLPAHRQWRALLALDKGSCDGIPTARDMLERVARDPTYDIEARDEQGNLLPTRPNEDARTLRSEALHFLARLGVPVALDYVFDQIPHHPEGWVPYELFAMPRDAIATTLVDRLQQPQQGSLLALLEIAGWYGDGRLLSILDRYSEESDTRIADAAYEAAERLRGQEV